MTDRTVVPPCPPIKVNIPRFEKHALPSGIPVYIFRKRTEEILSLEFVFRAGLLSESRKGQSSVTNALITAGTRNRSENVLNAGLESFGASIEKGTGSDSSHVSLVTLNKFFPQTFPLLEDVLLNASYPEKEISIYKQQTIAKLRVDKCRTDYRAKEELIRALFPGHPYGTVPEETDYAELSRTDLVSFKESFYTADHCFILLAGNFDTDIVLSRLENIRLAQPPAGNGGIKKKDLPAMAKEEKVSIPMKGTFQTSIRLGLRMIPRFHPDYAGLQILTFVLGGYFGSRLMNNLREKQGYTYSVSASLVGLQEDGYMCIEADVDNSVAEKAISEILKEINLLTVEKIPGEELQRVKEYLLGQFSADTETPFQIANLFRSFILSGIEDTFFPHYISLLQTITPEDLLAMAQKYWSNRTFTIVYAGGS